MNERAQNIAVGLTVMGALAMLAGMIVLFAGGVDVFGGGYNVHIHFPTSSDVQAGEPVHMSGIRIGKIKRVDFTDPTTPSRGVTITVNIFNRVSVPAHATAVIYAKSLVGRPWLELKTKGPTPLDPGTGALMYLARDGSVVLKGVLDAGSMIPPELLDALGGLTKLGDNLNRLIAPDPGTATQPATEGLVGTMSKLNATLDAIRTVIGDAENQANIKAALANLAKATQQATEAMNDLKAFAAKAGKTADEATLALGDARKVVATVSEATARASDRVDELTQKLIEDAEKVSALMTTLNQAAAKIDAGEGTAGKLLNDPKLYNSLLEATQELNGLLKDLGDLVETWKKDGVGIKLK